LILGRASLSRFALVGAFGFAVDASVLTLLVSGFGWHHYAARAVSFLLAVTCTWYCNRRWVFASVADRRHEYGNYFAVQVVGAAVNLTVYVLAVETFAALAEIPVVPLAFGAAVALTFNFFASRRWVFAAGAASADAAGLGDDRSQADGEGGYSGRENLESMKDAKNYNAFLLELLDDHAGGGAVLDFGAGVGTFAAPLAQRGRRVLCVEPDPEQRGLLAQAGLPAVAGLDAVPAESVDSIYTLNVLEHIEDDDTVLRELYRRLRPGGRLLIYVPAFQVLFTAMDRRVGHFRRYRNAALQAQVRAAGFEVDRGRYVDSLGFFVTLLYKWVGSRSGVVDARSVRLYDRFVFPLSKICDSLLSGTLGKNIFVVATKR
jgi:putative flippase GtrA/SAM-dependent methyltransferase